MRSLRLPIYPLFCPFADFALFVALSSDLLFLRPFRYQSAFRWFFATIFPISLLRSPTTTMILLYWPLTTKKFRRTSQQDIILLPTMRTVWYLMVHQPYTAFAASSSNFLLLNSHAFVSHAVILTARSNNCLLLKLF